MKKEFLCSVLVILVILLTNLVCTPYIFANTNDAVISGTLPYKNQILYLYIYRTVKNLILKDVPLDSALIDSSGNFRLKTNCSPEYRYTLKTADTHIFSNLFCKNGDSLILRKVHVDSLVEIVYDKSGATNFFASFNTRFSFKQDYWTLFTEKKWKECYAYLDNRTQEQAGLLMMNTYLLSSYPVLKLELEDIVRYQANKDKLIYLSYNYYDDNDSVLIQDKRATDFMSKLQFDNRTQDFSDTYVALINNYLEISYRMWRIELMATKKMEREERLSLRFEFCKSHLSGISRDYGIFYSMSALFIFVSDSTAFRVAEKQLLEFKQFATDKRYLELCTKLYNTKLAVSAGHIAPNFTLPNINSQNISLSDFKGKTIYMEFTGTWCGPCRKEIPAMKELQRKCKDNNDIQFITIWLEGAESPSSYWSNYVQESGLGGVHLYSRKQFNGEVPLTYQISGVPSFMIIDKSGRIAIPSAKRPSEDGVYEEINSVDN